MSGNEWAVRRVEVVDEGMIEGLADVLMDCVEGGGVGELYVAAGAGEGGGVLEGGGGGGGRGEEGVARVAEDGGGVCGTVQLVLDLPENQPHRADLVKMLVHRRARRRGLGAALMRGAEGEARQYGKTLLVLDAVTGGDGERLYERLGWVKVGVIPGYALMPGGELCDTTFFYRVIG